MKTNVYKALTITRDMHDYIIPGNTVHLLISRYNFHNLHDCRNYPRACYDKKNTQNSLCRKYAFIAKIYKIKLVFIYSKFHGTY